LRSASSNALGAGGGFFWAMNFGAPFSGLGLAEGADETRRSCGFLPGTGTAACTTSATSRPAIVRAAGMEIGRWTWAGTGTGAEAAARSTGLREGVTGAA